MGTKTSAFRSNKQEIPKGATTIKEQKEDTARAEIRNDGSVQWEYGAGDSLQVCLDGIWYVVPAVNNFDIPAILYVLEPADVTDRTYSLNGWGDLPSGQYRINVSGLTAEITLN